MNNKCQGRERTLYHPLLTQGEWLMAVQKDLACRELVEVITEYLEGSLRRADRVRFEQHLKGCGGCRNYVEQMRQTIRLTGRLKENSVSLEAKQILLELFRDWKLPKTGR